MIQDNFLKKLIEEAQKAMKVAIAPYSGFKVGASLATKEGKIYSGCNIENPSLMLSICAEKTALANALSKGEKSFRAVAIISNGGEYCYPCGSCRQILWEFAGNIDILLQGRKGIKKYTLNELLPYPFNR